MKKSVEEKSVELTERIIEMIEGESVDVLEEIVSLLNYHAGYRAGIVDHEANFTEILNRNKIVRIDFEVDKKEIEEITNFFGSLSKDFGLKK
ncbi:hypothetical protein [Microcystis phage MaeS]|nr:hypothetical protein [Microcystis phage MaeS]